MMLLCFIISIEAYTQGFIACDDNLKSIGLFAYIGKTKVSWKFHIVANLRMLKEFGILRNYQNPQDTSES
ncbi:hypothetical protein ACP8HZ_04970 [Francisella noatunensis]